MSKGINKVILVGNAGNDPEMRYLPSGTAVVNVSVATGESKHDTALNATTESTEWHRVVLFGHAAEICAQYLRKGNKVGFIGKLKTRRYEDKEKITRYVTEVIANDFTLLESSHKTQNCQPVDTMNTVASFNGKDD